MLLSEAECNYVLEREGKRIYLRKALDFHRPKALMLKPISLHKNGTDIICKVDGKIAKSLAE